MKNNPFAGKSSRTKIFTVVSIVAIVLLFLLNVLINSFGIFGNFYIDMTPEGLYTLTPKMKTVCEKVFYTEGGELRDPGIKITFCNDPDNLIEDTTTRIVYYMAVALSKEFKNCSVETVNIEMNPTAVAQYKTTSLTKIEPTDVIVSYGSRYSIVSAGDFWHVGSDNVVYSYDGEYKMASVMLSLTLVNRPSAYFVTDHGETYYDAENPENEMNKEVGVFADLLKERGFEIKTLSLSAIIEEAEKKSAETGKTVIPEINEDCVLLIINNPKEDFRSNPDKFGSFGYVSETELLDRYMTDERGSIVVSKDYGTTLPNFEDFLAEWGMSCTDTLVSDPVNSVVNDAGDDTSIIADYNLDENTYAYDVYGDFASVSSAPRVVINNTGAIISSWGESVGSGEAGSSKTSRIFAPFLYSSDFSEAKAKSDKTGEYSLIASQGKHVVAAVGGRQTLNGETGENTYAYIFCAASPEFFSSGTLGNSSYANYDIVSALVHNIARLETHADNALGGLSLNNKETLGGKMLVDTTIRDTEKIVQGWNDKGEWESYVENAMTKTHVIVFSVIIFSIPLAIAVVGIVLCIKRKYL